MKIRWSRFNIYLMLLLAGLLSLGCQSAERKRLKQISILRLHLETRPDGSGRVQPIVFHRANPVTIYVNRAPFVTEQNVKQASVVDAPGGFAIKVEFRGQGKLLLDQYTGAYKGSRIAIFGTFGLNEKGKEGAQQRWLAAPVITQPITDGILVFTPDASREEADEIVLGLNNAAEKYKDFAGWPSSTPR